MLLASCSKQETSLRSVSNVLASSLISKVKKPKIIELKKTALLTGKVECQKSSFFLLHDIVDPVHQPIVDTIQIADGSFRYEAELNKQGYYALDFYWNKKSDPKRLNVFLGHSDSLWITFNGKKPLKTRQVSGRGEYETQYIWDKSSYKKAYPRTKQVSKKEKTLARADLDSIRERQLRSLVAWADTLDHISPTFLDLEETDILYSFAQERLDLEEAIAEKTFEEVKTKFVRNLNLGKSSNMQVQSYADFLLAYREAKTGSFTNLSRPPSDIAREKIEFVDKKYKSSHIRDYLKRDILISMIKLDGSMLINDPVSKYTRNVKHDIYRDEVIEAYIKHVYIQDGMLAPDVTFMDADSNKVSISDWRGKYVYIDIWASWCVQCLNQMPAFKQLERDYAGKGIRFVSINVDDHPARWKARLKASAMSGKQYHASGGYKSDFAKAFLIKSLPRYILLDPDGIIVALDAPRPTSSIRAMLDNPDVFAHASKYGGQQ